MRILVLGSLHFEGAEAQREAFCVGCRELGEILAKAGHTIIVGSDSLNTADRYVVEGSNRVSRKHIVAVRRLDDDQELPFEKEADKFPNITFDYDRRGGDWTTAHIVALSEADILIVLGGGKGTERMAYAAEALRKPVLAIPTFGGAAADIWKEFSRYYDTVGVRRQLTNLLAAWREGHAQLSLDCAEALFRRNPHRTTDFRILAFAASAVLLLIVVWLLTFLDRLSLKPLEAVFVLLFVSSLIGSGLRIFIRVLTKPEGQVDGRSLLIEAIAGILLGFSLLLAYLATGAVLTGGIIKVDTPADFIRVATTMSLIGLSAAFLVEQTVQRLSEWLSSRLIPKAEDPR